VTEGHDASVSGATQLSFTVHYYCTTLIVHHMSTYLTPHLFSSTTKQIAILLSLSHQAASFVCHTTKEGAHYFPKAIKVNTEPNTTTFFCQP
jgi:hypothetical protein